MESLDLDGDEVQLFLFSVLNDYSEREVVVHIFNNVSDDMSPSTLEFVIDRKVASELVKFIVNEMNVCIHCFETMPQGKRCNCMRDE